MNYKVIDKETYYRKGVFRHFTEDCKCSTSITSRIDVTELAAYSRNTGTKFYVNFLYILSKVLNSREDYRMGYLWQPCPMCAGAIMNARLKRIVYGAFDENGGALSSVISLYEHNFGYKPFVRSRILERECALLLTDFFKNLRKAD